MSEQAVSRSGDDRAGALLRFERAVVRRVEMRMRFRRVAQSLPAALQITIAATIAYLIARFLLGHPMPLVAVTVTITSLGLQRDARPQRVAETVTGILVGITLSEILLTLFGSGIWQLVVVLGTTLLLARLVSPSAGFAVSASVQSMLVLLVPAPAGSPFVRTLDGVVGGIVALLVTALIPRDPRRAAARDLRALVSTLLEALDALESALRTGDEPAADLALTRLRRTQALVDDANSSLETAVAIARISPFLRRHLPELRRSERLITGFDLAARHLRVITRRVDFVVRDGDGRPVVGQLVADVARAIRLLPNDPEGARAVLEPMAHTLAPDTLLPHQAVTETVLVLLIRPLVVDLLVASGDDIESARALLPEI